MDFRKILTVFLKNLTSGELVIVMSFTDVIKYSKLDSAKTALEIGPGTGQATELILKIGCSYLAIELGENLAEYTKE